jgi:alkanesulfonate monooxygenase SsuD/methylene tetrahydromethanopterin reductase-like flavin-dependent oxidoreductase (luciferase family)
LLKPKPRRHIYEASHFRRQGCIVGTPEQVAEQLKAYIDLGVTVFFLRFDDFPSMTGLSLFTEQVIQLLI